MPHDSSEKRRIRSRRSRGAIAVVLFAAAFLVIVFAISGPSSGSDVTDPGTYPGPDYSETNYPDTSYPDASYPDTDYPDTSYPDTDYPDASYPDTDYPDTSGSGSDTNPCAFPGDPLCPDTPIKVPPPNLGPAGGW